MVTLEEIQTMPKKYWGLAWLLLQKHPDITLGNLGKLVNTTLRLDDLETIKATSDDVVCAGVCQVPRDVQECRYPRETELCRVILGDDVCDGLASGMAVRAIANVYGKPESTIRRQISTAKKTITPSF